MHEPTSPTLPERRLATELRPLHTLQRAQESDSPSDILTWTSSVANPIDSEVYHQAFVELVSRLAIVEPGESFFIKDTARGGYIEAQVGANGRVSGWSFALQEEGGTDIHTDFSIGDGQALQLHVSNGKLVLKAQANFLPQAALHASGLALQDILMHRGGTENSKDTEETNNSNSETTWTQPSVLNWPPQEFPVDLLSGDGTVSDTQPVLLNSWFEQAAHKFPQRIALDFLTDLDTGARTQFTYRQVSNAANSLAERLHELAASTRLMSAALQTVAVALGPSPELYIGYLAALKAGVAFCPLPVDAPADRQAAILADLQPIAVLVHTSSPINTGSVVLVDAGQFTATCDVEKAVPDPPSPRSDSDAAYVLYTSGTTGLPKGVIVSHRSAACTVSALSKHYGFPAPRNEEPWRWFQGAAPTFDISLFEIFWTLSTGSTLCCAPRYLTMQNIDAVLSLLQADITNVTPSFASLISPSVVNGLMVGGEALNSRLLEDFAHNSSPTSQEEGRPHGIYNGYGPTEVAIYSLAQPHVPVNQRGSVIGSPLATCGVLIVDQYDTELVPLHQGAIGELVLTGPQVSTVGYLNRPDETGKSFVDDKRWGRAYRTGDRARIVWDENSKPVVEFLGRISDAQVKLSGRRVELAEIENVFAKNVRGVRQTLACVWKPQAGLGSERVVSLVVVDPKSGLDFAAVKTSCNETARLHLPDYMRPFRILEVAELPRAASGKVNRKAAAEYARSILQKLLNDDESKQQVAEPSESPIESKLVEVLSAIVDGDGIQSNLTATTKFASAGVDSLRAMRFLRELRNLDIDEGQQDSSIQLKLQPSLAMLLDPEASIRSVFFASNDAATTLYNKQAAAHKRINGFAERHTAAAIEHLSTSIGTLSESDVEMVLPMTSTASQLAVSFAMDHHNYISNTILPLDSGVSMDRFETATRAFFARQAVYRSAVVPCTDGLSPFAQVVLKPSSWQRWSSVRPRIVRQRGTGNTEHWLDVAQEYLDLDAQQLYFVQLVESANSNLLITSIAHCLCDGASVELLLSDIAREYAGLGQITSLSLQDAVLDWASNLDAETDRHWQTYLQEWEADSFHALSGDNVKASAAHKHELATFSSAISWQELESKSRSLGRSPLSILQAAWALLLKIWSEANTEDIVFGSVLSGQQEACHAPTFSVVPCRIPLPEHQTVQTLIGTLMDSARYAQGHRHMSFGLFPSLPYNTALALQAYGTEAEVAVPWTVVKQPAIRYDFDLFGEVLPRGESLIFKVTYRSEALSETSAAVMVRQFAALADLLLAASPNDSAQGLLSHIPHDLLSAEGTIPLPVTDIEKENRVDILHAQFESQASATPNKLALSFYDSLESPPTNLTYAELDARANGLANVLRLEDANVIPICMHRSIDLYVSILAIIKAGSAWSPIDETSPVQRRTSLIARTQGKVLLTTSDSFSLVEPCLAHESLAGVRVIFVDQYAGHVTNERPLPRPSIGNMSGAITGQDLAYLLWTSGTTGEPKGVMMPHAAAAHAMRDLQVRVEHDPSAGQVRTLQLSAYSFDVFVQDLFYTWGLAGSVISGTRELVLGTFTEFVKTARPTHAHLTPSFGASIDVRELAGSTLRFVTFIGEKLTEDVAEAWAAPDITTKAYNTYGPAENAVVSTMRQFFGKSCDRAKAANVGFPLTPCTAYVVREVYVSSDDKGDEAAKRWELVPRYGVGELALGGAQVGKGYLNNEAKTTKSFIFNEGIGERIYLTGDMVRLNDHGFEFLGRNDDLVKITGIRIELSEISAACALVKETEAALEHVETLYLPRPGGDGSHKVIVSFVSVKESDIDTSKIRQQVFQKAKEVLPAYMVPGHVAVLNTTMPRTASNKVDRKALQAIYATADLNELAGASTSTDTKVEWSKAQLPVVQAIVDNLAVPLDPLHPLHPDDSLAGHGFSSLQITKLAWALRRQHDCSLRVLDLMRCQTVGELVDVVVKAVGSADNAENKDGTTADAGANGVVAPVSWVSVLKDELTQCLHGPLRPDNTAYILPAIPVQESLLVETLVQPGAYWSHRLFDLTGFGAVDAERLQSAWAMAAVRLDILRTVFVPLSQLSHKDTTNVNTAKWAHARGVHATVLQLVLNNTSISWTELDNDAATANDFASRARKIQSALAPLGGENALPPWAVTYAPASRTLMLSMHHSLYDGESSRMLLDVVSELYRNPVAAGRPDLPPLPLLPMSRGLDLGLLPSIAQRDEATAAWSKHLHGLVETDGSLNAPFPDLTGSRQPQSHAIFSSKATIPDEFLALAHNIDRPELPRLVLSAFGCVLAALLELKTIVLGQTVSQRILHPDLSRVVGPAVATLPVAIRTHSASARDLWSSMSRDASSLGTLAHHLHPVDVKKMANEVSGDPNAPFPALFVYHPAEDEKDTDNTRSLFHEVGQALALHVEHPMALNVFEDGRVIELTGDARRISQPMLDVLLAQVLDQARTMLSHPNVPLPQIVNYMDRSLVSIVGEHKALVGTSIAMNPAELVAKQVAEHSDWVAIEEIALDDDDNISTTTVTYGQLQTLVDAIVSRLMTLAVVNPGDVVAVYLERNAASLAAILAIFKLNCVYLPIDGDLPTVRKQLLVQDANAVLVLTTESLVGDLDITVGQTNSPYIFLLPDGDDDLDTIMSWPTVSSPPDIDYPVSNAGGYLLYTSGSTGRPKGVRVTNESLLHYVAAMTQRLAEANPDVARLGGVGKFLNVASRAFDTHLTTMFAPWHLGFCSVIGKDRNGIFANLQHVINTVGITNMGTVPSVLLQLGLRLSDVPSIRVMTFGGEKASHELFDQLGGTEHDGDGKAALMNFYGPTEAAVGCMSHVVGHHSNARNLGLPLPGLEAILLVPDSDGDAQIVARRGQPGEFCIAGPQVAVGYLDRPEENARSFQHTTLLGTDGTQKRIYRTGDIMRMMYDGTVEFLGRRDQQTKIRGQRFEIGEVEAYIKKVIADQGPLDVAAAVVDQRLIGLLARKHTSLFKAEREAPAQLLLPPPTKAYEDVLAAVEQACQQGLPSFMVPEMMWLSKMPFLSASGKLDTKLIIQLVRDAGNADNGAAIGQCQTGLSVSTSPLSESEKEVTDALAEVLGSPVPASSSSNIRILGIDSLSGVHLLSVLKRRGFSNVTLPDLFSPSANIHAISNKFNGANLSDSGRTTNVSISPVTKLGLADLGPCASHIDPSHVAAILPCLPLQSSLVALSLNWLHNQDDNQSPTPPSSSVPYVTEFNFQLEPTTNVELWRQATEQVVSSEAVLSTLFVQREQDGQIFQVVLSSPPSPFLPLDGSHDYNAALLVSHISSRPPIRLQVRNGGRVSLLIHHALYDGAAIATLRAKIEHSYRMLVSGQPVPSSFTSSLASLRHLAQHCNLTGQQLQSVKTAWQCKLVDTAPCLVARQSSGTPKPASDITIRTTRRLALTATQLKEKLQNVSTSTALQVATALVVSSLTAGSLSVVYGFTTSLRQFIPPGAENIDMDQFIGPCLNTVVHALSLQDGNETLPQLSARVAQYHAEVGYGHMPLITADQIQRWAGLDGKIFDSLLTVNFVDAPGDDGPAPIMRSLPGKAKLDLALTIDVNLHADGRIELMLASTGVLDEAQLATAGQLFETVLENASNSLATVSQFVHVDRTAIGHAVAEGVVSTSSSSATSRSNSTSISSTGSTTDLGSVRSLACQLLRLNEAGVPADVSLYRLGLDSINVLPFVKLISKVEGIKVTPNAVLRARTLQGVASLVHAAKLKNTQQTSLVRDDAKLVLPNSFVAPDYDLTLQQVAGDLLFVATPLQEGMLSASLALADQAYTYTHTMQLSPAAFQLDAPRFEHFFAAVQETVLSCEILRTRFIFTDHSQAPWVGVVSPSEQSDLLNWNVSVSGVIQLRIHHALYDASSIQNLWRLLRENYTGQLSGASIGQAQRQTHLYRPFAKQVAIAQKNAVEFWVNTLQDYNFAPISLADDGADLQPQHASSSFHFSMHATQFDSLLSTCRNASVTLKAALQLAWVKVLCEILYKQADIVFGEVITTNSDDAASSLVMGPTINTIPMRLKLTLPSSPRSQISIYDALIELQSLGDNARGPIGMASLRDVQTAWRSSRADGTDTSAGLFQSLFVFDGDVSSASTSGKEIQGPIIPVDATDRPISSLAEKAPLYDDYPLIASFRIRDGVLHGALRAKASESTVHRLGSQLTAALHYIASSPLQTAALDPAVSSLLLSAQVSAKTSPSVSTDVHMNGSKNLAESVLELAKQVIGARIRGNVDYGTKLVNIGLDSISAIRYSNILKKTMGIHVSVFDIIKGATVASIVQKHSAADKSAKATVQSTPNTQRLVQDEDHFKSLVAAKLGLPSRKQIKSVAPILSGQRHTLLHWLKSGKRFFEAPWVYRVSDSTFVDEKAVAGAWKALCTAHDVLRTTFVSLDDENVSDLVQITLHPSDAASSSITVVRDTTTTISGLVQTHVRETNDIPSNLISPPSRLSFIEGFDGQAIVFRLHHALYDAWSIKMILSDLNNLFGGGTCSSPPPSLQSVLQEMATFRDRDAEQAYWKQHLAGAKDSVLRPVLLSTSSSPTAPLGPHFKSSHPDVTVLPVDAQNKTQLSATIIAAYAHSLGQLTNCSQPTFGLNYSGRSLSSINGSETLELTDMSVPTMTVVPMSVTVGKGAQQQSINDIQTHLAALTKFAQADGLHKLAPSYNTHINILFADPDKAVGSRNTNGALQRYRLGEPLASEYFTTAVPSPTATSTIDGIDFSLLPREQLYFNVLVRDGSVSVDVSGDMDLVAGDSDLVSKLVCSFASTLANMMSD